MTSPEYTARNRESIMLFFGALTLMALHFTRAAVTGGIPMPPETHGTAMYAIPAIVWGAACLACNGAAFLGAAFRRPVILAAGAFGNGVVYIALAVLSRDAPFGLMFSAGSAVVGVLSVAAATAAYYDAIARHGRHPAQKRGSP